MGYRGECSMSKIELEALALTPAPSWSNDDGGYYVQGRIER